MWMLSVVVPASLEQTVDDLVGELAYIIQCWGKDVDGGVEFKYAFRAEEYARLAEGRIRGLPGSSDLRVWNDTALVAQSNGHTTNEELADKVMSGDVEAAKEWRAKYPNAYTKNGRWYHKFPGGKSRRFNVREHAVQDIAMELTKDNDAANDGI